MRRTLLVVLAVLASLVTVPTLATPSYAAASRPEQQGRWLLDEQGRVRIDHGVNMVSKRTPYAADSVGFGADDARFLARNGFTSVRLGVIWKAVEPRPGQYDDAYLDRIERTVRILDRHGIVSLLDFHQDLYNERFQGEGAPDWAVQDDGIPAQPQAGFPANYFVMTAMWRAYDHFWANDAGPGGVGLQDRYAAAWRHVAKHFRDVPGVQGFDIFNEPFPGSQWPSCFNPLGCPVWDQTLTAFSQRVIDAIRAVDSRTTIYYEPNLFFNDGIATHVAPEGERLGFSFHIYCGTSAIADQYGVECDVLDELTLDNADAQAAEHDVTPMLTEFGATQDPKALTGVTDLAMKHLTGWQYWAYCGCDDPTTTGPGTKQALVIDPRKAPRGANVDSDKLRILAVPHPLRVAGEPLSYGFDRATRIFRFTWSGVRVGTERLFPSRARTTVVLPELQYPDGYRVISKDARVLSESNARVLVLALERASDQATIRVEPR